MSISTSSEPSSARDIRHNEPAHRFEYRQDGWLCVLEYSLDNAVATFTYTGVPPPLEGRGIAADMVRTGLETARARGWRVRPVCSYVLAYIERHPQYRDLTI